MLITALHPRLNSERNPVVTCAARMRSTSASVFSTTPHLLTLNHCRKTERRPPNTEATLVPAILLPFQQMVDATAGDRTMATLIAWGCRDLTTRNTRMPTSRPTTSATFGRSYLPRAWQYT